MHDQSQLTNGVPKGVDCTGGVLNGTKKGFWAATRLTEDDANKTRVWKCERDRADPTALALTRAQTRAQTRALSLALALALSLALALALALALVLTLTRCEIPGVCLGGDESACAEGYAGVLCDSCAPGYWGKPKEAR